MAIASALPLKAKVASSLPEPLVSESSPKVPPPHILVFLSLNNPKGSMPQVNQTMKAIKRRRLRHTIILLAFTSSLIALGFLYVVYIKRTS